MKTQVLLDQREVAQALKEFIQNKMAPGLDLDVTVFLHGEHPKKAQSDEAGELRKEVWRQALTRSSGSSILFANKESKPEDLLLATWGALVIINGSNSDPPTTSPTT